MDAGCNGCHMDDGSGNRDQGAPNLTDAIWLYGGTREAVTESIYYARFGVMPDWNERLSEDEIRAVAFYVPAWAAASDPLPGVPAGGAGQARRP